MSPNLACLRTVQYGWIAEDKTTCSSNKYKIQTIKNTVSSMAILQAAW